MSQHTPAPWRAVNGGPFVATIHNTVIAKVVCTSNEGNVLNCQTHSPAEYETIANALLIAEAPTMYSLLEDILHQLSTDSDLETITGAVKYQYLEQRIRNVFQKIEEGY